MVGYCAASLARIRPFRLRGSGLSDWLATGRYRGIRDSAICRRRRPNHATVHYRALRVSLGVN